MAVTPAARRCHRRSPPWSHGGWRPCPAGGSRQRWSCSLSPNRCGLDEVARLSSYDGTGGRRGARAGRRQRRRPDGGKVRIIHPMYGEVIRSELPVLRGALLRLRLAEAVQSRAAADARRCAACRAAASPTPVRLVPLRDCSSMRRHGRQPGRRSDAGGGTRAARRERRRRAARDPAPGARPRDPQRASHEAEAALADAEASAGGDPDALEYVTQRLHVLLFGLRRADEPRGTMLERTAETWRSDPAWTTAVRVVAARPRRVHGRLLPTGSTAVEAMLARTRSRARAIAASSS